MAYDASSPLERRLITAAHFIPSVVQTLAAAEINTKSIPAFGVKVGETGHRTTYTCSVSAIVTASQCYREVMGWSSLLTGLRAERLVLPMAFMAHDVEVGPSQREGFAGDIGPCKRIFMQLLNRAAFEQQMEYVFSMKWQQPGSRRCVPLVWQEALRLVSDRLAPWNLSYWPQAQAAFEVKSLRQIPALYGSDTNQDGHSLASREKMTCSLAVETNWGNV